MGSQASCMRYARAQVKLLLRYFPNGSYPAPCDLGLLRVRRWQNKYNHCVFFTVWKKTKQNIAITVQSYWFEGQFTLPRGHQLQPHVFICICMGPRLSAVHNKDKNNVNTVCCAEGLHFSAYSHFLRSSIFAFFCENRKIYAPRKFSQNCYK